MHVGTVFPSFMFDVFSGAARAVTFSPPSWISLVSIYVVGVCPYYNVLEYQPLRSSIAKVTVLRKGLWHRAYSSGVTVAYWVHPTDCAGAASTIIRSHNNLPPLHIRIERIQEQSKFNA